MSYPDLTPVSQMSKSILPVSGSHAQVDTAVPYRVYSDETSELYSAQFVSGAVDQVTYTYRKLGGDVLDIELSTSNVYTAYEEATLEYSYIINIHQASNALPSMLGDQTGTFDSKGQLQDGDLKTALNGSHASLKLPKFQFGYAKTVSDGFSGEAGQGGTQTVFQTSFVTNAEQQDYDLQQIVEAATPGSPWENLIGPDGSRKKILIKKVYYRTPSAAWRFYGYYGGLNVVGNLHNYGQFSDDSSFQLVPTWHNKAQALAYEDAIYTRLSHWSYEITNNNLRLHPVPRNNYTPTMWFRFVIPEDAILDGSENGVYTTDGINNMNTLPFSNLPFENINSIGKQWIRRFALALSKEMLGQIRSKFGSIPIPGESVTLNGTDLITQGREEQEKLREELKTTLAEMTYPKLLEQQGNITENTNKIQERIPLTVFVG